MVKNRSNQIHFVYQAEPQDLKIKKSVLEACHAEFVKLNLENKANQLDEVLELKTDLRQDDVLHVTDNHALAISFKNNDGNNDQEEVVISKITDDLKFKKILAFQINWQADANFNIENPSVPFEQSPVMAKAKEKGLPRLKKAIEKYDGLCEIICNHVVMNDDLNPRKLNNQNPFNNYEKTQVLQHLENEVAPLHILRRISFFQLMKAVVLNKIPNNLLNQKEQKSLLNVSKKGKEETDKGINMAIDRMQPNQYVKYYVYNKTALSFEGHAILIRKNSDNSFSYFDPNAGAKIYKSKDELVERINQDYLRYHRSHQFNNICFMDAAKMLPVPKSELSARQINRPK